VTRPAAASAGCDRDLYDGREHIGRIAGRPGRFAASLADGRPLGVFARYREAEAAIFAARRAGRRP
jgi:hypothetical protein